MPYIARRHAQPADREFACGVHHRAFEESVKRQFGQWDEAEQDRFFEQAWDCGGITILTVDGERIGYMRVEDRDQEIFLATIAIAPEFQNQGLGSEVIRQEIRRARIRDLPLVLQVLQSNRALSLYRKLGFETRSIRAPHYVLEFQAPPLA